MRRRHRRHRFCEIKRRRCSSWTKPVTLAEIRCGLCPHGRFRDINFLHISLPSPLHPFWQKLPGQSPTRTARCGRRTKRNWTKTAHCTCVFRYTCTLFCGYELSIGPTECLSLWWYRAKGEFLTQFTYQGITYCHNLVTNHKHATLHLIYIMALCYCIYLQYSLLCINIVVVHSA